MLNQCRISAQNILGLLYVNKKLGGSAFKVVSFQIKHLVSGEKRLSSGLRSGKESIRFGIITVSLIYMLIERLLTVERLKLILVY